MRVILGEQHTLVRAGLRRLVEERTGAEVIGEAGDGRTLLEIAIERQPELVMTEIDLPILSGFEVLAQLRRSHPEMRVLMLSRHRDGPYIHSALRGGACGYLIKDAEPAELELAMATLRRQQTYLSPSIAHNALERRANGAGGDDRIVLTPRQREVLQFIARGRSTKEIAGLMGVSIKTVETHRARMMDSLGLYGTNALMRYAIRLGFDQGVM
jgi:DNA-binding NarL/FixJ family response regulator